jgi:hypothetical protein
LARFYHAGESVGVRISWGEVATPQFHIYGGD